MQILLIEDDEPYASILADELRAHGNGVLIAASVRNALAMIEAQSFDAVVVERTMPEVDGIAALRWLRGGNVTVPIVLLSALDQVADRVDGLNAGADDYVVKPVAAIELDARLRALVRGRLWATRRPDTLRVGVVSVSPSRGRAWGNDAPLRLSDLELKLLTHLMANVGTVMTRAMLVEAVWGYDTLPDANIVDVHVSKLRRKLVRQTGSDPIVTVRGAGYMIDD